MAGVMHSLHMGLHDIKRRFSPFTTYFAFMERRKTSDKLFFAIAFFAFAVSLLYALFTANALYTTSVPTSGGTLVEGIVGTPRFVNPALAITRADHDMVALVYSGLMKINTEGSLVNDVAESITLSEDGKTYTIILRKGVRFHNGAELTAKDVLFTIGMIQNPDLKSPLRGSWDGVAIEELGEYELSITLREAHSPFLENLTVGILPRELWDQLPTEQIPFSQNNIEPIGSGPYRVTDVMRNKSGLINAYKLSAFSGSEYNPNITTVVFNFYQNENELLEALRNKQVASTPSLSNQNFERVDTNTYQIIQVPLPRTFAVYFNQNKATSLRDAAARQALDIAIDKEALVHNVLSGYGIPTDSPIPTGFAAVESASSTLQTQHTRGIEAATQILTNGNWKKNGAGVWEKTINDETVTLSMKLTTANTPLFEATATYVANVWRELGVEVQVDQFEQTDLVQSIIRPRDFQALLYGADIGRQVDLYPFWHSSQKNDPGLNIAQYTNIDVDAHLTKLRTAQDATQANTHLIAAAAVIQKESPAIFLFVPTFGYVIDKDVTVTPFVSISKQSERFANIALWHIRSSKLWPIFSNI